MKKRGLSMALALLLMCAAAVTGCGSKPAEPSATEPVRTEAAKDETPTEAAAKEAVKESAAKAEETGKKVTIGYDIYFLGNSWSVQLAEEFKQAAELHKDQIEEVIYVESDNDTDKQIANLEDLIASDVDVIITTPCSSTALVPVLKEAREAGIKVVLLAAMVESDDYDCLITVDDTEFGKAGAKWLAEELGGKGNIICLNGISGISASDQRWEGAQEVFSQYPDIKILAAEDAEWDYAKAKVVTNDLLAAYPEIDGVWSQGGAMTLAAIEAFQTAGRKLVPMTGEDNNGYLKKWYSLQDQGMRGIACAKPTWLAEEALTAAIDLCSGKEVKKDMFYDAATITDDDLADYVRTDLPDDFWANTRLTDEKVNELFGSK